MSSRVGETTRHPSKQRAHSTQEQLQFSDWKFMSGRISIREILDNNPFSDFVLDWKSKAPDY